MILESVTIKIAFHPLPIFAVLIIISTIWAGVSSIWYRITRQEGAFALSCLALASLLNIMAYLTGFTIGIPVAIIGLIVGIVALTLIKQYKIEFLISCVMSLLLLLSMQGITTSRLILIILLGIMVAREAWNLRKGRDITLGLTIVKMLAYLFGISLLLPSRYSPVLSSLNLVIAILFFIKVKQYRWQSMLISVSNFLWLLNNALHLHK